jgi:hypothetical protein
MIKHPLSAPSTYGDGPSTLGQRKHITRMSDLLRSVRFFWDRRWQPTEWLKQCSRELITESVFQARCLLALKGGQRA